MSVRTSQPATGTIALADQLIRLRVRVPLTGSDIRKATGAEPRTLRAWLDRQEAPVGAQAARLCELIAIVKLLEGPMEPASVLTWLRTNVEELKRAPLGALAAGKYEQVRDAALTLLSGRSV